MTSASSSSLPGSHSSSSASFPGNPRAGSIAPVPGDLPSVRACPAAILARNEPIHGLINNAGLVARGKTKDGFELVFGTNHLGHYLFTRLLLDRLRETKGARIVNVSSNSHYMAKGIEWSALEKSTQTITGLREYSVSKLANVLFTKELARQLEGSGVTTYAVHPGQVATDAWRRIPQPFRRLMKLRMVTPQHRQNSRGRPAYQQSQFLPRCLFRPV